MSDIEFNLFLMFGCVFASVLLYFILEATT